MIKAIVMDVDGTLTDGTINVSASGEHFKAFNVKDGYAIVGLKKINILPIIITGRSSEIVEVRMKELGVNEIHQGVHNKVECLQNILERHKISFKETAYIGDDVNDYDCMKLCGYSGAPADAMSLVFNSVDYKCVKNGGAGAVREFIDNIIQLK